MDNSIRVYDRLWAGEKERSRLLEGFELYLDSGVKDLDIEYMGHLQNKGDTAWIRRVLRDLRQGWPPGGFCDPPDRGAAAGRYDVFYQAVLDGTGETAVCANGEFCGTRGESRGCLAMKIWIRQKPV